MATVTYEMNFGDSGAGLSPSFEYFVDQATGNALAQPTISEAPWKHGSYLFEVDWSALPPTVTTISWKASVVISGTSVEQWDVISNPGPSGVILSGGSGGQVLPTSTGGLQLAPTTAKTSPGGQVQLSGAGGTGTGYSYSILANRTGGSINATTGLYTAGPLVGIDTIQLSDSAGNLAAVNIQCLAGLTVAALRLLAQQRSDTENDPNIGSSEWLSYLNGAYAWLYGTLVTNYAEEYPGGLFGQVITDGVNDQYPLANDFFKLLGVDMQWSGSPTGWLTLHRFANADRNRTAFFGATQGIPDAGTLVRYRYAPRLTKLALDTDVVDGLNGWEDFVAVEAARRALVKQERDASDLAKEVAALVARIEAEAKDRDPGEAPCVVDVHSQVWGPPLKYRLSGNNLWLRKLAGMLAPYSAVGGPGLY